MRRICLTALLLTCMLGGSAQNALRRWTFEHPQMGTVFRLVLYSADSLEAARAARAAFDRADALNAALSDYLPESETNVLCSRAGTKPAMRVSPDLWRVLRLSKRYARRSDGAFDCTIGPLSRLWRRARHFHELPDSTRVLDALTRVGYRKIRMLPAGRRVRLDVAGMQLDFGGIAQGYAADACLLVLRKQGFRRAMADAGGDIALGDPPPGAAGWTVEVPEEGRLVLRNCGITRSGATYQYLESLDGRRFSHIIDPRTGWGLTHRRLVTVVAPSATAADAWATALSVRAPKRMIRKPTRLTGKWRIRITEAGL